MLHNVCSADGVVFQIACQSTVSAETEKKLIDILVIWPMMFLLIRAFHMCLLFIFIFLAIYFYLMLQS